MPPEVESLVNVRQLLSVISNTDCCVLTKFMQKWKELRFRLSHTCSSSQRAGSCLKRKKKKRSVCWSPAFRAKRWKLDIIIGSSRGSQTYHETSVLGSLCLNGFGIRRDSTDHHQLFNRVTWPVDEQSFFCCCCWTNSMPGVATSFLFLWCVS